MIDVSVENRILFWGLQFPPLNEIGLAFLNKMENLLDHTDFQNYDVLVLYSKIEGGFSSGANLHELYQGLSTKDSLSQQKEMKDFLDRIHNVMNRIDMLEIPTVGVIHGVCFGGGFELALTCDVLIAETHARFCFPELRLGILPCFGGIPRLKRDLGNAVVRDFLLTGRSLNARRAHELGLVSQVVPKGEGFAIAKRLAVQISKYDSLSRHYAKQFMKPLPIKELEEEKRIMLELFSRPVLKDALRKFIESNDLQPYLA